MDKKLKSGLGLSTDYIPKWEKEWQDMPEFVSEDLTPFKTILVHFRNKEDMKEFGKLLDQGVGLKTKSVWFPKFAHRKLANLRYADEK